MKLHYTGKTKDVYKVSEDTFLLKFKDDVTGENGVFDPGANTVGLSIEGMGRAGLRTSVYFFGKLAQAGVKTHCISADLDKAEMTVRACAPFGKGLEVICRYRAVGSFHKRYGGYVAFGQELPAYVEMTLKDDDRGDPLINQEGLEVLGVMSRSEYDNIAAQTRKICGVIRDDLAARGLTLYDIKLEFGRTVAGNEVILIDELSAGNMRVYKGDRIVEPLELGKLIFG